jgi:nitronate monooxygenase
MAWRTRLTEALGIEVPILSAPMAGSAGGQLAAAVSSAGGLGLLGGGFGVPEWLEREFAAAGNARIGCGFITWSLARRPEILDAALAHRPAAVMLSFGDPAPFAGAIRAAGCKLICQVQNMDHVRAAVANRADIIVAQGAEAGGHGAKRATLTLTPEVADLLAKESPATVLVAAGGIADGRGMAAAMMLGADGVLLGSRLWASAESLTHPAHRQAAVARSGDETLRGTVGDLAWGIDWPAEFSFRVLKTSFIERWHGREDAFRAVAEAARPAFMAALAEGRTDDATAAVGEAIGLMREVLPAGTIVAAVAAEAAALLRNRAGELLG